MKVVVVESPAKAKTINRYLGEEFKVLASYGHVCDLPSKDGSVLPDNDFEMKWQVSSGSEKHLKDIISALKRADKLCSMAYMLISCYGSWRKVRIGFMCIIAYYGIYYYKA